MFASRLTYLVSLGYSVTFRNGVKEDLVLVQVFKNGKCAERFIDRTIVRDAKLPIEEFCDYTLMELCHELDERYTSETIDDLNGRYDRLVAVDGKGENDDLGA